MNTKPLSLSAKPRKMFGPVFYFLILLNLTVVAALSGCNGKNNCKDCVKGLVSCRWCKRDGECYNPGAITTNPCKRAENIVEQSHCDYELSKYDPELSMKMLLLSAAAYDEVDPQNCLDNALPSAMLQVQFVVTRKCDDNGNECSAYVARSHALKAIIVAFRGSMSKTQALKEFIESLIKPKKPFLGGEVQSYWKRGFQELWTCMEADVKALVSANPSYQVWVTGHSLGGAMASLASTWLAYYQVVSRKNIILYTFGMPRVGNYDYALKHDELVNNSWRVVNYNDAVPHFPTFISLNPLNGPYHHGVEAYYTVKATSPTSEHKECHGKPYNEDKSCSFTTFPYSFETHTKYFSIPVGTFWKAKCLRSMLKKREATEDSKSPQKKFEFKQGVCSKYKYRNGTLIQQEANSSCISASKLVGSLQFFLLLIHISV